MLCYALLCSAMLCYAPYYLIISSLLFSAILCESFVFFYSKSCLNSTRYFLFNQGSVELTHGLSYELDHSLK